MGAERAMDTTAFYAKNDTQVNRDPFDLAAGATIRTPAIALIIIPYCLEQFRWVLFKAVAVAADVDWASSHGCSSVHTVC